jgi:hypothetical protein
MRVLNLWLIVLVVTVSLIVFLWIAALFVQSYIYTEASPGLAWQAPATGVILGAFFAAWCWFVVASPDARPTDIPYDTLFRFSPRVDMTKEPVRELWAIKKNDEKVRYVRFRHGQNRFEYKDGADRAWNGTGVKAIELEHDGEKYRFEPVTVATGAYPEFASDKGDWTMKVFDSGPTGAPTTFRTSRFLANLALNLLHFVLWFACLWLVLRFQWAHALGFAFCAWLLITLAMLPMILGHAAEVAQRRASTNTNSSQPTRLALAWTAGNVGLRNA